MIICSFGSKGLETISNGSYISFNTVPTLGGAKHNLVSTQYEDCLETTIQICKSSCTSDVTEISSSEFRTLTKWLSRKKFLRFKLYDENNIDLYHEAIINVNRIEIDGKLYGLELEIVTNRPFALKESKTINLVCKDEDKLYCWEKYNNVSDSESIKLGYVTSKNRGDYPSGIHTDGYVYTYVGQVYRFSINDISHEEGHIYPCSEIAIKQNGDFKIYNTIENRETYIANCKMNEIINMDYPVIKSSDSSHNIQNDFNWNFFRIANTYKNSRNDLIVFLPCEIKIKYSPIVKVGL